MDTNKGRDTSYAQYDMFVSMNLYNYPLSLVACSQHLRDELSRCTFSVLVKVSVSYQKKEKKKIEMFIFGSEIRCT